MHLAADHSDELDGTIIIDSPVRRPDPESLVAQRGRMFKNPKQYPDLQTAMEHFHLVPPQPVVNPFIVEHIARHSLREHNGHWTWKFDPRLFHRNGEVDTADALRRITCPLAVIHGQLSNLLTEDVQEYMEELTGRSAAMIEIPQAHHHVPLDQPLALISAIRSIVGTWSSTEATT
jgi:pimeloyl-ACP methyl ester carboxylesterase